MPRNLPPLACSALAGRSGPCRRRQTAWPPSWSSSTSGTPRSWPQCRQSSRRRGGRRRMLRSASNTHWWVAAPAVESSLGRPQCWPGSAGMGAAPTAVQHCCAPHAHLLGWDALLTPCAHPHPTSRPRRACALGLQDAELARLAAELAAQAAALDRHYEAAAAAQAARLARLQQEVEAARAGLQRRYGQLERALACARAQAAEAQREAAQARREAEQAQQAQREAAAAAAEREAALGGEAEAARRRAAELEGQLAEAVASAVEQAQAQRRCGAEELQAVQQRLLGVLATKDGTIAALQAQLAEAAAQLQQALE